MSPSNCTSSILPALHVLQSRVTGDATVSDFSESILGRFQRHRLKHGEETQHVLIEQQNLNSYGSWPSQKTIRQKSIEGQSRAAGALGNMNWCLLDPGNSELKFQSQYGYREKKKGNYQVAIAIYHLCVWGVTLPHTFFLDRHYTIWFTDRVYGMTTEIRGSFNPGFRFPPVLL